ncbi:MAG: hypothetical protein OEW39_08440 [Deltaproteobacteria bacterium]|nr:hypothetical protein [Deltaproteobacteria bacterium]
MSDAVNPGGFIPLQPEQLGMLLLKTIQELSKTYQPGKDRVISPENVFQQAVITGRDVLEHFQLKLFKPGSGVEGLEHLDQCLADLRAGRSVLFLPEHRGNFDVPSFHALLRREAPRYHDVLDRLVYVAGRKLNESSDLVKMFTEKYSRLVIVPKRDYPPEKENESPQERQHREDYEKTASRINRAAFREMLRLKKEGRIFVLFPTGGRIKAGFDNQPVREATSYIEGFDRAYLVSMEGNTLPPAERMEDERPVQEKIVFRVGPGLDTGDFLTGERQRYDVQKAAGRIPESLDKDLFAMRRVMAMLEHLRLHGNYGSPD